MLNYPQISRKDYDELFEEALHLIPLYSKSWTNFNMSDPAVTVLENLTAFQALQMEKMDTISEKADLALLALAGFSPKRQRESEIYVTSFDVEMAGKTAHFAKGTKFITGERVFEIPEDTDYTYGQIISAVSESGESNKDYTDLLVSYKINQGIYPFGKEAKNGTSFIILTNAMPKEGRRLKLYAEPADYDKRRNSGKIIGSIFADIEAEIYTETGYVKVDMNDGTGGFLSKGYIDLEIPKGAAELEFNNKRGYAIKFTLNDSRYDKVPKISKIEAFLIRLVQRDTKAVITEGDKRAEEFEHHVDFGKYVVNACDDVMRYRRVGFVHGFDEEHFELTPFRHIVPESLEFVVEYKDEDGNLEYRFSRDMKEFSFHLENEDSELVVDVPGEAVGGELLIAAMALYDGPEGNIIADNVFEKGFYNPARGEGGRFRETKDELQKRFAEDLKKHRTMVNEKDYEQLIRDDKRLLIDKVHAWRVSNNEVNITVKPVSEKVRPKLSKLYKKMMCEDIDKARMLTTKVFIKNPIYVGLQLKCEIQLKKFMSNKETIKSKIRSELKNEIEKENFGAYISFKKLYNVLRRIDEIEIVEDFYMIPETYEGVHMQGNDIQADDNCMIYPSDIEIKLVR